MEQPQPALRNQAHKVSFRPALIQGRDSGELFITLNTRNCPWGKCLFCGLGKTDGENKPLLYDEAVAQVHGSIRSFVDNGGDRRRVGMVSLISNSDSVFDPETVQRKALLGMLCIISEKLPAVAEIVLESRAESIEASILSQVSWWIDDLFERDMAKSVAVGIESPYAQVRREIRKGLPNCLLFQAARNAAEAGFGFRGYFIYNLLEPEGTGRFTNMMDAVLLMSRLAAETGAETSMLILRGYVPARLADTPLMQRFKEVPDDAALNELRMAAVYAKNRAVRFEIDSTIEDQKNAASVTVLSPAYLAALERYNTSMDPKQLKLRG